MTVNPNNRPTGPPSGGGPLRWLTMTWRGIVLGLGLVVAICAFSYFHDFVIHPQGQGGRLVPHLMPPVIYGGLILIVLGLNPLLALFQQAIGLVRVFRPLSAAEIAMAIGLALLGCGIPSWGLVQCLPPVAARPHHDARQSPSYREAGVVDMAPDDALVDANYSDEVISGYMHGLGQGREHIALSRVPWAAWRRTLWYWLPPILAIIAATLALGVVLHRQWAHHEQLPYPIQRFARSLMPEDGRHVSAVFQSRMFWNAALIVGAIHINNYLCTWWPDTLIRVNLQLDISPLGRAIPFLARARRLMHPRVLFAVVGIAYFLPSTTSFSVSLSAVLFSAVMAVLNSRGITLAGGEHLSGRSLNTFLFSGGYFGILLMLLYTGRHFYWNVLKRSVLLPGSHDADPGTVWAARVFLACTVGFVGLMAARGVDWQLALLFAALALMTWTVVSRIIAETGAFFIGTYFVPVGILIGFLGARALGPEAVMALGLAGGMLMLAPAWAPMPFATQAYKLMDLSNVRVPWGGAWMLVALLLGVAVALPLTLYFQYDRGLPQTDWPTYGAIYPPRDAFQTHQRLAGQGLLDEARARSGWERFTLDALSPSGPHVFVFVLTASLAVVFGLCHLRFTWWPFHPVIFVFFGSGHGQMLALSLLIGLAVKLTVNKYGGARLYHRLKPLMVGLIAGEVVAQFIPMVVGAVYFAVTGKPPK
jgi:hypothetical protein